MKTPERIYVDHHPFNGELDEYWYTEPDKYRKSVEYVRKDVVDAMLQMSLRPTKKDIKREILIEKAIDFFSKYITDNSGGYDRAYVCDMFRKYVKGEIEL